MKKLITLLILTCSLTVFSQVDTIKYQEDDFVFTPIDTLTNNLEKYSLPKYKGGFKALHKFIVRNVKYPEKAINDSIQGKVIISIIINSEGKVGGSRIKKGLSPEIDSECIHMLNKMPAWNPATRNNKSIDYRVTFPVNFILWD